MWVMQRKPCEVCGADRTGAVSIDATTGILINETIDDICSECLEEMEEAEKETEHE